VPTSLAQAALFQNHLEDAQHVASHLHPASVFADPLDSGRRADGIRARPSMQFDYGPTPAPEPLRERFEHRMLDPGHAEQMLAIQQPVQAARCNTVHD
jgi:hypothetical protein